MLSVSFPGSRMERRYGQHDAPKKRIRSCHPEVEKPRQWTTTKNLTSLYIYAAVSIIYIPESGVINTDLELEYSDIIVRSRKFRHFYTVSAGVSVPQCPSSVSRSVEASPLLT